MVAHNVNIWRELKKPSQAVLSGAGYFIANANAVIVVNGHGAPVPNCAVTPVRNALAAQKGFVAGGAFFQQGNARGSLDIAKIREFRLLAGIDRDRVMCSGAAKVASPIGICPGEIHAGVNDPGHSVAVQFETERVAVAVVLAFATTEGTEVEREVHLLIGAANKCVTSVTKEGQAFR